MGFLIDWIRGRGRRPLPAPIPPSLQLSLSDMLKEGTPVLGVRLLRSGAHLPARKTLQASGLDLFACLEHDVVLAPMERASIPTGISISLPEGYEGQVRARSGLARDHGIGLVNGIGSIDQDFRGEIHILLINFGSEPVTFQHGQRVAQLVICPVTLVRIQELEQLSETERGVGGFGSTGL